MGIRNRIACADRKTVALCGVVLVFALALALAFGFVARPAAELDALELALPVAVSASDDVVVHAAGTPVPAPGDPAAVPPAPVDVTPSPPLDSAAEAAPVAATPTTAPAQHAAAPVWALRMLEHMNRERRAVGAGPLALDGVLMGTSARNTLWMTSHFTLCHSDTCSVGARPSGYEVWAENVGYTGNDDVDELHRAFMASPRHRRNVLDPRFTRVGVGYGQGAVPGGSAWFMTVQFAR
jgi:uncharacterized protein YkwD